MKKILANHYPSNKGEIIGKKKQLLKKIIKDGKGGPGTVSYGSSASALAPYKNAYYKKMKAAQAFGRIAKITGLDN